jgi:hypothetical protein
VVIAAAKRKRRFWVFSSRTDAAAVCGGMSDGGGIVGTGIPGATTLREWLECSDDDTSVCLFCGSITASDEYNDDIEVVGPRYAPLIHTPS